MSFTQDFRFEIERRPYGDDGAVRPFLVARCAECDGTESILDAKGAGKIPEQYASKLFTRKGWRIGNSRVKDFCPSCTRRKFGRAHVPKAPVLKGEPVAVKPDPQKVETALGAKLVEAAIALTQTPPKPVEPSAEAGKVSNGDRFRQLNQSRTKEERAELARLGAARRRERLAQEAEIARLAAEQERDARRERKGAGVKSWWASMTQEERSARAKRAAATLARKRAGELPDVLARPKLSPGEVAQAKNELARASIAPQPQETAPMNAPAPVAETATRQATREQNRTISDALDANYDIERQCYRGSLTDKLLAEKLKFPAAWVGAVRDQFFGPDKNEAADKFVQDLAGLKKKQTDLQASFTRCFEELTKLEGEMNSVRDALARACQRAGVPVN